MFAGPFNFYMDIKPKRIKSTMKQKLKSTKARVTEQFRRLAWNELVVRGDFVEDGQQGFKPWDGPTGFRADSFVIPTYRQATGH